MKVGQIGPTFVVPGKMVIFLGVKSVVPSSTLKMTKSQKKLARVCAYTPAYMQIRDGGGRSAPPELNRVNTLLQYKPIECCRFAFQVANLLAIL